MIYPATLGSLSLSPHNVLAEYQGKRYYIVGAQDIIEALDIRDRYAKDHPEVTFCAFIGRDDDMAIDGDWQTFGNISRSLTNS